MPETKTAPDQAQPAVGAILYADVTGRIDAKHSNGGRVLELTQQGKPAAGNKSGRIVIGYLELLGGVDESVDVGLSGTITIN